MATIDNPFPSLFGDFPKHGFDMRFWTWVWHGVFYCVNCNKYFREMCFCCARPKPKNDMASKNAFMQKIIVLKKQICDSGRCHIFLSRNRGLLVQPMITLYISLFRRLSPSNLLCPLSPLLSPCSDIILSRSRHFDTCCDKLSYTKTNTIDAKVESLSRKD